MGANVNPHAAGNGQKTGSSERVMNTQPQVERSTGPYGQPTGDALAEVGYPSIWLIFLLFPAVSLMSSDADLGFRVLGGLGILAFAGLYVASWWWTTPIRRLGPNGNTFVWFAALFAAMCLMVPSIGANAMSCGPFLTATLAFRLPFRTALAAILPLVTGFIVIAVRMGEPFIYWVPSMMLGSGFLMLGISTLIDREDRAKSMAHDLEMARQRETIGRDVHDLLGHSLTVITVKTELARKLVERDPQRAAAELDEVLELSREALGEVRATVGQLRTPEWSAQLASSRTALRAARIDATLPSTAVEIPTAQKELLAWCLREAVTNVIRHSRATRCAVEAGPGRLVVTDDGVGAPEDFKHGNGLRGMADRVAEAGGSLSVGPNPATAQGFGTRLEVLLP